MLEGLETFTQTLDRAIELNPEVKPLVESTRLQLKATIDHIRDHLKETRIYSSHVSPECWFRDQPIVNRGWDWPPKADREAPDAREALERYFTSGNHLFIYPVDKTPRKLERTLLPSDKLISLLIQQLIKFRVV